MSANVANIFHNPDFLKSLVRTVRLTWHLLVSRFKISDEVTSMLRKKYVMVTLCGQYNINLSLLGTIAQKKTQLNAK